ncbi:hypothetical protein P153DRAFT_366806 [Dothidotthia symphoricarpi CBS 119687]|uniref:ATPase synthesis protein 25 n=1 Tax=Dothidotthia symphoricarpi CBS 119687 TaxID=1392245 RepID=A0A6A6AEN9_9PLEO|nr:uncharacterized protein P153DRAFT_366806 [Dothidotthia symphoricarpi CBS 119687]KAF2129414.1 hypothetical protein P153DRAFT_366806 [Dothidotthia symphoricarpi CBS 119687]
MFLSRAAPSRFVCNACRNSVIRPSQSISTPNGLILRAPATSPITPRKASRCAFSTSLSRRIDEKDDLAEDDELALLDEDADLAEEQPTPTTLEATQSPESTAAAELAAIPWYLRQQGVVQGQLQKPAEIPDLPPNPPPLLATLLEYISITAGLDDLELLDLRHLDPPPALGPKLIMLIATARSEKHLHVAADRFCRYLRREHNLKANAAGLLGRNELKIKLRRKAKRMRMLANVGGAAQEGNLDDGIRTGWICCTLSKIEAHELDMHMPGDNVEEFVGFRDVKPGVNVVVQMFTEEKRAETDLETLWGGVLRTQNREVKQAEEALMDIDEDEGASEEAYETETIDTPPISRSSAAAAASPPSPAKQFRKPRPSPGDFFPPASDSNAATQLRRLHTVGLRR